MESTTPSAMSSHRGPARPARVLLIAAAVGPLAASVVCLWSMLRTPFAGPPALNTPILVVLASTSLLSLAVALRYGINPRIGALGAAMGLAVAVPTISAVVHGYGDPPATAAVMGLSVAAAASVVPVVGPLPVRIYVLSVLTAVVWASLAVGVLALPTGGSAALYARGGRDWLGVLQLSGIAGHPNGMSLMAVTALVLQVLSLDSVLLQPWRRRLTLLALGPGASALALLWSQSRTGLITAAVVAVLLVLLRWQCTRPRIIATVLGVTAAASAIPPAVSLSGVEWSFHGRWFPWLISWQLVQQSWPDGVGPAAFSPAFWDFWTNYQPANWEPAHAHNQLLETTVLLGLHGLILLTVAAALMVSVAARVGWRDRGWAIGVCVIVFVNAGPETILGVGDVGATYLPVLIAAAVLASSWLLVRGKRTSTDRRPFPAPV